MATGAEGGTWIFWTWVLTAPHLGCGVAGMGGDHRLWGHPLSCCHQHLRWLQTQVCVCVCVCVAAHLFRRGANKRIWTKNHPGVIRKELEISSTWCCGHRGKAWAPPTPQSGPRGSAAPPGMAMVWLCLCSWSPSKTPVQASLPNPRPVQGTRGLAPRGQMPKPARARPGSG